MSEQPNNLFKLERAVREMKFAWADSELKALLPPRIYSMAHSKDGIERNFAQGWMSDHSIRVEFNGDRGFIYKFDRVVAQTQFTLNVTTLKGLKQRLKT